MFSKLRQICAVLATTLAAQGAVANDFDHSAWNALLAENVQLINDGHASVVDYGGFKNDQAELQQYLASLEQVSRTTFDGWSKAAQLAFLINAYNAWTVERVLEGYPEIESIKELGSLLRSPWAKKVAPLLGETRSLDDIEHGLIRGSGRYNEPRIHFAVNCASVGCPALLPEAFTAVGLEDQLDTATRKFLGDSSRNRYREGGLEISSIFKWYREDFEIGSDKTLLDFLRGYAKELGLPEQTKATPGIRFLPYDWSLNDKP